MATSEVEPNGTPELATLLAPTAASFSGSISSPSDVDTFRVHLATGESLYLGKVGDDSASIATRYFPGIEVFDPRGNLIVSGQTGVWTRAEAAETGEYTIRLNAAALGGQYLGTYHVGMDVGYYSGRVDEEGPAAVWLPGVAFARDRAAGTLSSIGDRDRYTFDGVAGQSVSLDFSNLPTLSPGLQLFAPNGTLLASDATGFGIVAALPATGSYTIEVTPQRAGGPVTGDYLLHVQMGPSTMTGAPSFAATSPQVLPVQSQLSGAGRLESLADIEYFSFTLDHSDLPNIFLTGETGYNRRISLFDAQGRAIATTQDVLRTADFTTGLTPGRYFIGVEPLSEMALGAYSLDIYTLRGNEPIFSPLRQQATLLSTFSAIGPSSILTARADSPSRKRPTSSRDYSALAIPHTTSPFNRRSAPTSRNSSASATATTNCETASRGKAAGLKASSLPRDSRSFGIRARVGRRSATATPKSRPTKPPTRSASITRATFGR